MAHALLVRTDTSTAFNTFSKTVGSGPQPSMNHAPRASQLSGSTAFAGSNSSIASTLGQNGGNIVPTANIINQKADASRSLYQICVSLKQRLALVPDFEPFLQQLDPLDPVDPLWNLLRTGFPLLTIYNSLQPTNPIKVEDSNASEAKKPKIAIFKFVQACMKELSIPPGDCFVITDLMGNDTSGFVKVRAYDSRPMASSPARPKLTLIRSFKSLTTSLTWLSSAVCSCRFNPTPKTKDWCRQLEVP